MRAKINHTHTPNSSNVDSSGVDGLCPGDLTCQELVSALLSGGVAVIPSDTIYGIVGKAKASDTVQKIRAIKNRGNDQALIVLCADLTQVASFGVQTDHLAIADKHWPAPTTIVLDTSKRYSEITGELGCIGFRIPDHQQLRTLLKQTGPLVAPSANPRGKEPAKTIKEAREYFGNGIDVYIDGGRIEHVKPSTLIKIHPDGAKTVLRA